MLVIPWWKPIQLEPEKEMLPVKIEKKFRLLVPYLAGKFKM